MGSIRIKEMRKNGRVGEGKDRRRGERKGLRAEHCHPFIFKKQIIEEKRDSVASIKQCGHLLY